MTFVLIVTLFGASGSPDYSYVIDYNMTGADCIARFESQQTILERTFHHADFNLSCEIDQAIME